MLQQRGRVVVDEVGEIIEIRVDRAEVPPRSVECRAVTLAAAGIDQGRLSGRGSGRNLDPPLAGRRRLRQRGEVGGQIGGVLVAQLALHEGGHDSPRLAHRAHDLGGVQAAAGEIRPKLAFRVIAVAVPACGCSGGFPIPIRFSRGGIARGRALSGSQALGEGKQKTRENDSFHGVGSSGFGVSVGAQFTACSLHGRSGPANRSTVRTLPAARSSCGPFAIGRSTPSVRPRRDACNAR